MSKFTTIKKWVGKWVEALKWVGKWVENSTEKMNIRRNIFCQLERRKKDGEPITTDVPILMIVTWHGHRLKLQTGFVIDLHKWDVEEGRVRRKFSNSRKQTSSEINNSLAAYEKAIDDLFKNNELKETAPTPNEVKAELHKARGINKLTKITGFYSFYDDFVKQRSRDNDWTQNTIDKFKTIKKHLEEFNPKLTFNSANKPETLAAFVMHLRKKGFRNTTISKHLRFVKTYLKWAYDTGKSSTDGYRRYTPNLKGTDGRNRTIIYLNPDEFKHLWHFNSSKAYLSRVKDVFLFCCTTGLRYSDAHNLKKTDIKNGYIEFTTVKTQTSLQVELNEYSRAILDTYSKTPFPDNKALPVISNQKMNVYLKELCKEAEINTATTITYQLGSETISETKPKYELIGTHTGRRTFVCLCLYRGIAPTTIMKWTGHTSYDTLKPYVDVMDALKKTEMQKFKF